MATITALKLTTDPAGWVITYDDGTYGWCPDEAGHPYYQTVQDAITGGIVPSAADVLGTVLSGSVFTHAMTAAMDNPVTVTTGTYTPTIFPEGQYKSIIADGIFTISPPTTPANQATTLSVWMVNGASADTVTLLFDLVTGDSLTTTQGDKFRLSIEVVNDGTTSSSLCDVQHILAN